ncbi:MAG: hypothetical protein AAF492_15825 [Verrucomicrobiota bacterium]
MPCYIPSKRLLSGGVCEADSSMVYQGGGNRFKPEEEDLLLNAIHDLSASLSERGAAGEDRSRPPGRLSLKDI